MASIPFRARPLARLATAVAAATGALLYSPVALALDVSVQRAWQFQHKAPGNSLPGQKAEIVAYDAISDTLWVAGVEGVDVLDRASGLRVAQIDIRHFGAVNSVAIHEGLAALAIENTTDRNLPGTVVFFNTTTRQQSGAAVAVGSLPDMLTFTPDGTQVLVANEGTPLPRVPGASCDLNIDPPSNVSIVSVASRTATTVALTADIPGYDSLRLFPLDGNGTTRPAMCAYGPEPEYIAIDKTGKYAHVVLQEANGIAVLNLRTQRFERIYSLGLKDFNLEGNEIDPSDRDGRIELRKVPVKGLYQPDTIASYEFKGRTYLVMANEGDARDNGEADGEDERRGSAGSGASELVPENTDLSRVLLSNLESAPGGPLVKFGGHSFSIRDTSGTIVFDSGNQLDSEAIRLGALPDGSNDLYDDGRSDNKGVEPEGVALLEIEGRVLAFIGLERSTTPPAVLPGQTPRLPRSAFAVYDITDPSQARYINMITSEGDRSPEGLVAFKAGSRYFVAVAHEVSDTTSLFEVTLSKAQGPQP